MIDYNEFVEGELVELLATTNTRRQKEILCELILAAAVDGHLQNFAYGFIGDQSE